MCCTQISVIIVNLLWFHIYFKLTVIKVEGVAEGFWKIFAKFIGKHLWWNPYFSKVIKRYPVYKFTNQKTLSKAFFSECYKTFQKISYIEHLWTPAFVGNNPRRQLHLQCYQSEHHIKLVTASNIKNQCTRTRSVDVNLMDLEGKSGSHKRLRWRATSAKLSILYVCEGPGYVSGILC